MPRAELDSSRDWLTAGTRPPRRQRNRNIAPARGSFGEIFLVFSITGRLKPSVNEPAETRFGDYCGGEACSGNQERHSRAVHATSFRMPGVPIIGAVKGSSMLRGGCGKVLSASRLRDGTRGTTLCWRLFSRPEAFVTSASLLACARNYCLRCRFVSV